MASVLGWSFEIRVAEHRNLPKPVRGIRHRSARLLEEQLTFDELRDPDGKKPRSSTPIGITVRATDQDPDHAFSWPADAH